MRRSVSHKFSRLVALILMLAVCLISSGNARELTLNQALDQALGHTARGGMIKGNLEVAEQQYKARRINMFLPEISINGSLPTYSRDNSYRAFNNAFDRRLFETTNLDFNSFIELKQSLITGGTLTATADLTKNDYEYPFNEIDMRIDEFGDTSYVTTRRFVTEDTRQGSFRFSLDQPLFRPSQVKYDLHNRRDDYEIAKMTHIEERATLKKEMTEAYMSVLQSTISLEMTADKLEKAKLRTAIDSAKLADGVLSEEDYLLSASDRLDAELEHFEKRTETEELRRELATLLDMDIDIDLELSEPVLTPPPDQDARDRLAEAWEQTVPINKARHQFDKAERQAGFSASGHRITGDLKASYQFGRGDVYKDYADDEKIETSGLSISLQFRVPLWDGGAGSAATKAARYEAEQARYEYMRAERSAQAQIINLCNQLDVSYQRLDIKRQQIDLAGNRLDIAKTRHEDGQISMLTLLESRIFYLESKNSYLDELKSYLVNQIELEGKFIN